MIAPIRFRTKEEIEALNKRFKELGHEGLVKHFLELGWELESAIVLANAMLKNLNENDKKKKYKEARNADKYHELLRPY